MLAKGKRGVKLVSRRALSWKGGEDGHMVYESAWDEFAQRLTVRNPFHEDRTKISLRLQMFTPEGQVIVPSSGYLSCE